MIRLPNSTLLLTHLGLGDVIISNAIVRAAVEAYGAVTLPVKECNVPSVEFMFRDIDKDRLDIYPVPDSFHYGGEKGLHDLASRWRGCVQDLTHFHRPDEWISTEEHGFDRNFYRWAGLPIDAKFSGFRCDRDISIEMAVPDGEYVFLHDTPEFSITREVYGRGSTLYHADDFKSPNIWAYRAIIENAAEVHVINSSFLNLIDFLEPKGRLVWHKYARPEVSYPTLQLDWEILS